MCGVYKLTNVISISYGESETDLPASYMQRQCMSKFDAVAIYHAQSNVSVLGS